MTDKWIEAEVEQRLRDIIDRVEPILDLPGVTVTHRFRSGFHDEDHLVAAVTETLWQYRRAVVDWYLGKVASESEDDLLNLVVHEYVHVLLGPIKERLKDRKSTRLNSSHVSESRMPSSA